jgi:hypothetical protein
VASSDLDKSPTRSANRRGLPAIVHTATLVRNGKFFVKKIMAVDKDGWIDYEFNSPAAPRSARSKPPASVAIRAPCSGQKPELNLLVTGARSMYRVCDNP